jgi:hypothetical protein
MGDHPEASYPAADAELSARPALQLGEAGRDAADVSRRRPALERPLPRSGADGYPPLLLDLESKDRLDHVLFLFRRRGLYGTVARSRDFGLHGRKPVFRTLRRLVMSYVDPYVDNTARITGYGVLDLGTLKRCDWRLSARNVWSVERALIRMPHQKLDTSDGRHRRVLRQFRAFKQSHPDRPVDFYQNQDRWM